MGNITLIGIATFEISRPLHAAPNASDNEHTLLVRAAWVQHSTAIARAAMSFSGAHLVQATGLDCRFDKVFVRMPVPSDMDVDKLPALGEELAKAFYLECGLDVDEEVRRRTEDEITKPIWSVYRESLTKD